MPPKVGSLMARIRQAITGRELVGVDRQGNAYYRWHETINNEKLEKRRIQVAGGDFLYDPKNIAPEWRMWLQKTRQEAPTEEEMSRTAERAHIMRQRVAALDEQERQRRFRLQSLGMQAAYAGGPDEGRFVAQLEQQGFGGEQGRPQQQQQQQRHQQQGAGPAAAKTAAAARQPPGGDAAPGSDGPTQQGAQQPRREQQPTAAQPGGGTGEGNGSGDTFEPGVWRP